MSLPAIDWALKQRVGTGYLKATLVAIAACYRGGTVSREQIEREACRSDRTIRRHLTLLETLGFIKVVGDDVSLKMGDAS